MPTDMDHMNYLEKISQEDIAHIKEKESGYKGSWKKRGGPGAFFMLARKWDRIENTMAGSGYDIFNAVLEEGPGTVDGLLDDIADLRRYLLLVEAEIWSRTLATSTELRDHDELEGNSRGRLEGSTLLAHRKWAFDNK